MAGLTREQRVARAAAKAGLAAESLQGLHTPAVPASGEAPAISVLERRLQNPFGEPSAPVRLKDPTLFPRWFNCGPPKTDAIWRAKEMGWSGITPDMIVDLSQIGSYILSPDGYVARGERATEVLMCMPQRAYQQIQMAKTQENLRKMRDVKGEQHRMAEAAASSLGADAAEDMHRHMASGRIGPVGQVSDDLERLERLEPEA